MLPIMNPLLARTGPKQLARRTSFPALSDYPEARGLSPRTCVQNVTIVTIRAVRDKTYMYMNMNLLWNKTNDSLWCRLYKEKRNLEYTKVEHMPFDTPNHLSTDSSKR